MVLKPWEKTVTFDVDPTLVKSRQPSFVNFKNEVIDKDTSIDPAEKVFLEASNAQVPDIISLAFLNPKEFAAGQIHTRIDQWKEIIPYSSCSNEILD